MIDYDDWIRQTSAVGKPRSRALKALDAAIQDFHAPGGGIVSKRRAVTEALAAWQATKTDWRSSTRNKNKAVERLDQELNWVIKPKVLDQKELEAMRIVERANRENLSRLFIGAELTVKKTAMATDLNAVRGALKKFERARKTTPSVGKPAVTTGIAQVERNLNQLLMALFDANDIAAVKNALGGALYDEFMSSVTPFLGTIRSGANAVGGWIQTANQAYARSNAKKAAGSFAPGDPAAAFDAVIVIMDREVASSAKGASIETVAFSTQALLLGLGVVGGDPIVGAAKSLAKLVQRIYEFATDYNERKAANDLLRKQVLDLSLFSTCPLLGCYLVACSDTSAVVNMAVSNYGNLGWKLDVEVMLKKAKPVMAKARQTIRKSRYEIVSLRNNKGVVADATKKTAGIIPTGKIDSTKQKMENRIN